MVAVISVAVFFSFLFWIGKQGRNGHTEVPDIYNNHSQASKKKRETIKVISVVALHKSNYAS